MSTLNRTLTVLVGAMIPALVACADNPVEPERPLTKLPRPLTASENAVIHANNGFAFELLREVAEPGQNVFVSPPVSYTHLTLPTIYSV